MLLSVLGAIIPPMVILSLISLFYDAFCSNYYIAVSFERHDCRRRCCDHFRGIRHGENVAKSKDWVNVVIMVISFCVSYFLKVNIIYIILIVAVFGFARTLVKEGSKK